MNFTLRATISAIAVLALGLSGCTSDISIGDGGTDGGSVVCGASTCSGGQVCCNASCGICADPGEGCIAIACTDAGLPDAGSCGATTCGGGEQCCTGCTPDDAFCMSTSSGVACPDYACPPPPICGDTACGPSDICCDNPCDGTTFCSSAGAGCPVFDCPPPPTCGGTECAPGEECCADCDGVQSCNAGGCPPIACPPPGPCDAQNARGEGLCELFFGYAWDGSACTGISGCSCVGADCDSLYADPSSCASAHTSCGGTSCGGFPGATCTSGEFCDYPASAPACGAADGTGTCTTRPTGCSRVYDPVCGCDGRDYSNACIANLNGTDVSYSGICPTPSDCRTTSCATGESCIVCGPPGTGYSCVADGTVCPL
ncbi:MAG: hypothetical protein GXP55_02515 [Deltaproteobacteria bacterium]|nr:hypothetical protein [Deltaproteobacteria bacterium]